VSPPRLRLERCTSLGDGLWKVDEQQAHHLLKVLRVSPGENLEGLLAGERCRVRLESAEGGLAARVLSSLPGKGSTPRIVLLASLLKGGDFEHLLRGATETGVSVILPVEAARSVPRITEAEKAKKVARWSRILEEATLQCGAPKIPLIAEPAPLEKILETELPALRLAGILEDATIPIATVPPAAEVAIAIGPEGDWDEREKEVLRQAGFKAVSLGPLVLKAFVAAIVACSYLVLAWEGKCRGNTQGEEIQDQGPRMPDKPV